MATPDHSIDPRIFSSAKKECLANGFEKTSLKAICEGAGITTGALYKRYSGKEDLFCAVVADTVADLHRVMEERSSADPGRLSDEELAEAWDMKEEAMMWWFQFLFERYDGFVLLLKCAEGTAYSNFQHDWVEMMTTATYGYYSEAVRRGLATQKISRQEMHALLTAFWACIYEPFIHGFAWDQLESYCKLMCRLFNWYPALGFSSDD